MVAIALTSGDVHTFSTTTTTAAPTNTGWVVIWGRIDAPAYYTDSGGDDAESVNCALFHPDPKYLWKRNIFERRQNELYLFRCMTMFNVFDACFYRRMPLDKSGFIGRAGKRKKN